MNFSFRTKLMTILSVMILMIIVVGLVNMYLSNKTQKRFQSIIEHDAISVETITNLLRRVGFVHSNALLHLLERSTDDMDRYEAEIADWVAKIGSGFDSIQKSIQEKEILDEIAACRISFERYVKIWDEELKPLSRVNHDDQAFALARKQGPAGAGIRETIYKLNKLHDVIVEKVNVKVELAAQDFRKNQIISLTVILCSIIFSLVFGIGFGSRTADRVNTVTRAAQKVAAGDFNQKVEIKTGDEIESMADSFNIMTGKLKDLVEAEQKAAEQMRGEIVVRMQAQKELKALNKTMKDRGDERTEMLMMSERTFRKLIETLPVGVAISTPGTKGTVTVINRAQWKMFGYDSKEEFLNLPASAHYPDPRERESFSKLRKRGAVKNHVLQLKKKDGSFFWCSVSSENQTINDGSIQFVNVVEDISELKRAEALLIEEKEMFRALVEESPFCISIIGRNGEYEYINPKNIETFGYTLEDIPNGREWFRKAFPDVEHRHQVISTWIDDIKGLKPGQSPARISTVTCKDGSEKVIRFIPVLLVNGKQFVISIDITKERKLEEQFRQAQKMESVGRLAGGVAHDYNNVLSVIIGFTELAMDDVDPTGSLHANLDEVLTAAKRATDITRQLLAFARKQTIAPKVLDLNDNVEGMLKMLRRLIGEDIDLAWLPGASLWPVELDPSQIDQVLANLCINARDAIEGVGKVTIETETAIFDEAYCADHLGFVPGEFVMLAVSDNGCGMDKEILDNIFEPFFTTKDVDKGTGLGLAMVYGIVKQNNGFINVYSEPGKGTTIKIYLSRHEGKAVEIQGESTVDIPPGRGETVLLVEDELSLLKLARKILDGLGYTVLSAGTPGEAMSLAEAHDGEIHLLVTDVIMPEMNGRELAERLQSLYPDLKHLFMSGYTANAIAHHGVLDKEVHFIQKPLSKRNLATTVRKVLDEKKS